MGEQNRLQNRPSKMPYSVEMFFDETGDAGVRSLSDALTNAGAPSLGDIESRPHVSLAVADSLDIPATCQLLDRFAADIAPFSLSLASVGLFPGPAPVVFLAPKVTADFLALHARFVAEFATVARGIWEHYSQAAWVPHCTLTMTMQPEQFAVVLGARLPIAATITGLSLVEFRPVRQLHLALLSDK